MRIFLNVYEMIREVERDLWEMGINVHPETMQDKDVRDNPDYDTKEVRGYGFKILANSIADIEADEDKSIAYLFGESKVELITQYIGHECGDRVCGRALNPGTSWKFRSDVWKEFMHDGKFAYTYSERMAPQLSRIMDQLKKNPSTRQAIVNIHSNLIGDIDRMGGVSRVPCSMYYQFMRREGKLDMVYTMRSCDFLTHFLIDILCALRIGRYISDFCDLPLGEFTYFTGSLHAYHKDLKLRGIF